MVTSFKLGAPYNSLVGMYLEPNALQGQEK